MSNGPIYIPIQETTIARLISQKRTPDEAIEKVIDRLCERPARLQAPPKTQVRSKYVIVFLGQEVTAETLSKVFAEFIDVLGEAFPEVLDNLSKVKTRNRQFLARCKELIHPYSPHLPTHRTKSGWWISKNIGQEDLIRALKKCCSIADLEYGDDLVFRARP